VSKQLAELAEKLVAEFSKFAPAPSREPPAAPWTVEGWASRIPSAAQRSATHSASCAFVERRENALLLGPTGVDRSHIAQALGHRACRAGFTVLHTSAQDVLKQLRAMGSEYVWSSMDIWPTYEPGERLLLCRVR
jgi:DNA replication protein DnaC